MRAVGAIARPATINGVNATPGEDATQELGLLLAGARRGVAFTGAGISTESGVPDFRSPTGVWSRYDPRDFTFENYVSGPRQRRRSWGMRREFSRDRPEPNPAHVAIAELERQGHLAGVVTQNIDGLHQAAGARNVVELHGASREVMCIGVAPRGGTPDSCGFRAPTSWAFAELDAGIDDPRCPECGGLVKCATVSFGQTLFPGVLERAVEMAASADLVLAVGSSLQVYPAAGIPASAATSGTPLAIVNDESTPLDHLAAVVVRGRAGEVLPACVDIAVSARMRGR
jgi:NAD-dependent deacetylase